MAKAQLRKQILANRPLSSEGLSARLIELVTSREVQKIASYKPLANEPDVSDFNAWASQSGIEIWFPKISGENLLWGQTGFQSGKHGISEPSDGLEMPQFEMVLVPALAIDQKGNRLGKGKGFYDRALRNFSGLSVGIVFEEELLEAVPFEEHDFKLDAVVTPKTTLFF